MAWLTGFLLALVAIALVAVVAEWVTLAVSAVVLATRRGARGHADPATPRNLERSLAPGDLQELRDRFAELLAGEPAPSVPPHPPTTG